MFKNDLYVTEISKEDFDKLGVSASKGVMSRDGDVHEHTNIEIDMSKYIEDVIGTCTNVVVILFKEPTYVKYYMNAVQDYIIYPDCDGVYKNRDRYTFAFINGESFVLNESEIAKIYLIRM